MVEDQDQVEQVEQVIHLLFLLHKEIMVVLQVVLETVVAVVVEQLVLVQVQHVNLAVDQEELEQQQVLQEVHYHFLEVEEETLNLQVLEELVDPVVVELDLEIQVIPLLLLNQVEQTKVVAEVVLIQMDLHQTLEMVVAEE